jgi:Bacteriocin-protection, YdeI or OmpD-Associated
MTAIVPERNRVDSGRLMPVSEQRRFRTTVAVDRQGRTRVPIPFDPDESWGPKPRHPVTGSVAGRPMRGNIEKREGGPVITLGPAWCRVALRDGVEVEVVLEPEGPQRADLAPDIATALDAAPEAAAFFDSLAQFYRTAWLRWIDSTKRRPDHRSIRIAEMVRELQQGHKERP